MNARVTMVLGSVALGAPVLAQHSVVTMTAANLTRGVARTDTNVEAFAGDLIEVRVYLSLTGAVGYTVAGFNYEPGVSGWRASSDVLNPIDNATTNFGSAPNALDGMGQTGRHTPYNSAMIATAGAITGFTTFTPGDLRIAGSKATPSSLANLMVASGTIHAPQGFPPPPGTQNLHMFTFRFTCGGLQGTDGGSRVLTAQIFRNGFGTAASSQGVGRWWLNAADASAANYPTLVDPVTITIIPAPGFGAALAAGLVLAACRRRGASSR